MPVNNEYVECNAICFGVQIEPVPISRVLDDPDAPTVRPNPCDAGVDASAGDAGVDSSLDARG